MSDYHFKHVSVCLCVSNGSGKFGGWDYSSDARPFYLSYFVLHVRDNEQTHLRSNSWSGHNWGEASWSWSGRNRGTAAEADAVGEQQLKRSQWGRS